MNMKHLTLGIALAAIVATPSCISSNGTDGNTATSDTSIRHVYRGNPLETRSDLQRAAVDVLRPLLPYYSEGGARLRDAEFDLEVLPCTGQQQILDSRETLAICFAKQNSKMISVSPCLLPISVFSAAGLPCR